MDSRRSAHLRLLWGVLLLGMCLRADSQPAQTATIELAQSAAVLDGAWKFHEGDNPVWAKAELDDSAWQQVDLTPPRDSYDYVIGTTGFVPGWTARAHPHYAGYAWYRRRVKLAVPGATAGSASLSLKMPDNYDDAYEVYVNGQRIGGMGRFSPQGVTVFLSRPRSFALPGAAPDGTMTIAIRTWMDPGTPLIAYEAGGLHGPPVVGLRNTIASMTRMDWDAINHNNLSHIIEAGVLLLALAIVIALARLDREEPTYLWLALSCAITIAILILILTAEYTEWVSRSTAANLEDDFLFPVRIGMWIIFWAHWFRFERIRQLHWITWSLVAVLAAGSALQRAPLYGGVVPLHAIAWLLPTTIAVKLMLGALLVCVAYWGFQRNRAEALLALPAVVLVGVAQYHYELFLLNVRVYFFPFGFRVALSQIGIIVSLNIITVLLVRRFLRTLQEREQWRHEIEQARQVQALLVPAAPPVTPGFTLETVYLPASRVGGDFFHVQPEEDGSLLLVVGDVSGKGLRAAMTASAIIGAVRNEMPGRPVEQMLTRLNRVLSGHISGFVTCCVVRIRPQGSMAIANAGHLPPYVGGAELQLEHSLPLGLNADEHYVAAECELPANAQLTLMTDGVVEARGRGGEMFGFERTQRVSREPAGKIAQAAQEFGQDDDITVVTVRRTRTTPFRAEAPQPDAALS